MGKYKFLAIVYLFSVSAAAIASLSGLNIQSLYRVPFTSFRWIDVSILVVIGSFFYKLTKRSDVVNKSAFIVSLFFIYLLFETFQLFRTWGDNELNYQISGFICTLNFFILIDLCVFKIDKEEILKFLKFFAISGACALIIVNMVTFYSFISGRVIITDANFRIGLDAEGQNESIYTTVLISYVYAFGLYFLQRTEKYWQKILFLSAIISIYLSLVYSFARGDLFTIFCITVIYLAVFSKKVQQAVLQVFTILFLLVAFYLIFGNTLRQKGYDPIEKISQTALFAVDVNNPNWEKGRSLPRGFAIASWKKNLWTGVGYDVLYHHGSFEEIGSAHNFIITSLFHRGLIGTSIYLVILLILFYNSVRLWFKLRKENNLENDMYKLLVIAALFWIVPFWNQEVIWEKYSLSIEFIYLGLITNLYLQGDYVQKSAKNRNEKLKYIHA